MSPKHTHFFLYFAAILKNIEIKWPLRSLDPVNLDHLLVGTIFLPTVAKYLLLKLLKNP